MKTGPSEIISNYFHTILKPSLTKANYLQHLVLGLPTLLLLTTCTKYVLNVVSGTSSLEQDFTGKNFQWPQMGFSGWCDNMNEALVTKLIQDDNSWEYFFISMSHFILRWFWFFWCGILQQQHERYKLFLKTFKISLRNSITIFTFAVYQK